MSALLIIALTAETLPAAVFQIASCKPAGQSQFAIFSLQALQPAESQFREGSICGTVAKRVTQATTLRLRQAVESPLLRRFLLGALAVAALVEWFLPLAAARSGAPMDFQGFYAGSKLWFVHHLNPQSITGHTWETVERLFDQWKFPMLLDSSGRTHQLIDNFYANRGYWNSPAVLILFAPLAGLSLNNAYLVNAILGRAAFLAVVNLIAWRLVRESGWRRKIPSLIVVTIVANTFEPMHWSLAIGQIEWLYLLPLVSALFILSSKKLSGLGRSAAMMLLAAGMWIKIIPGLFILIIGRMDFRRGAIAIRNARAGRPGKAIATLVKTNSAQFLLWNVFLMVLTSVVVGPESIPLWVGKWSLIQAQERIGDPANLVHFVNALWIMADGPGLAEGAWCPQALVIGLRLALAWPAVKILRIKDRDLKTVFLKAAVIASLLPTFMSHWNDYYNAVFIIPWVSGWLLAGGLPRFKKILSRLLLTGGFLGLQGLHNYYAGYRFNSLLARWVYPLLIALLRVPLSDAFKPFAHVGESHALLGALFLYPASLVIFLALVIVSKRRSDPGAAQPGLQSGNTSVRIAALAASQATYNNPDNRELFHEAVNYKRVKRRRTAIDIGSGSNKLAAEGLKDAGFKRVYRVDFQGIPSVDDGRGIVEKHGDATRMPFGKNTADVAVFNQSANFISEYSLSSAAGQEMLSRRPELAAEFERTRVIPDEISAHALRTAMSEAFRVLRPGSWILVKPGRHHVPGETRFLEVPPLIGHLRAAGFTDIEVLTVRGTGFGPGIAGPQFLREMQGAMGWREEKIREMSEIRDIPVFIFARKPSLFDQFFPSAGVRWVTSFVRSIGQSVLHWRRESRDLVKRLRSRRRLSLSV